MKRWQDIIDRLKEEGDWEAAAALWDARQAAPTNDEIEAIRYAEQMSANCDVSAALRRMLARCATAGR